jgi:hypothetical protein
MKKLMQVTVIFLGICSFGCDSKQELEEESIVEIDKFEQLKNQGDITGSLNPFPLVDQPAYAPVHELDYLRDDELVFITKACGLVQVFPHRSMHVEVVNDISHGTAFAITYCPITRSGVSWNRLVGEDTLLLTASGYLFRENLMPLDLKSGSIWSQMQLRGKSGTYSQMEVLTYPLIETNWQTVREFFPGADVFVHSDQLKSGSSFQLEQEMGIIGRKRVQLFSMDMFPGEIGLLQTAASPGGKVVVLGSVDFHYMTAFNTSYIMEAVEGEFPVVMKDETGSYWNVFGEAVSGERGGEKLQSPVFFTAAPWAWLDLYENVTYFD